MYHEDYDDLDDQCPACGGELVALGNLGTLLHLRCRQCGSMATRTIEAETNDE